MGKCELLIKNENVQIEKTVNYLYVCFNVRHPQFTTNQRAKDKFIYEFWLYHHYQSEFDLFLTSDDEIPNGGSENSVKLIGN